ncbi:MAG: CotH kinase family protein [Planctomycetota bacterium]
MTTILPAQGRRGTLQRTRLVERFDADKNGWLDSKERAAARKWLRENQRQRRGFFRRRRTAGNSADDPAQEARAEPVILPTHVLHYPDKKLYDPKVLRTVFLSFSQKDWREELADFYRTDVDVPAVMVIDGKKYPDVGVRYRGTSSYLMVPATGKKPLNISVDLVHDTQRVYRHRTLNLTNASQDPSLLREVVFADIAGRYVPTARANYVSLVVNGESSGVYVSVQQFNRDFLRDWFGTRKGVRWKILRNFGGVGALTWLGSDPDEYLAAYELKTTGSAKSDAAAWQRLIRFCKLLNETPDHDKEAVLPKVLDVDRTLWFLALEWVFRDSDSYVRQGYDYRLYEDKNGRFLPILYDNNEILPGPRGGRFGRGRRARGQRPIGNDPLEQVDNPERPLISRLLSVPAWRARYLAHVRTLASYWLDWQNLGPVCTGYHELIDKAVHNDPRKLYSQKRFQDGLDELRDRVLARRQEILAHPALKGPWPEIVSAAHQEVPGGAQGKRLRVTASVNKEVAPQKVILYFRAKRSEQFRAVVMRDDGKHGDGAAGDHVFAADTVPFPGRTRIRYYVEARADQEVGTTTFYPDKAAAGAVRYRLR